MGKSIGKSAKLKDLRITKIDFVEAGANPNANVLLYKHKKPTKGGEEKSGMFKELFTAIVKGLGIKDEHVNKTVEEISKNYEAATFDDKIDEMKRRQVTSEIWDVCYALESSLCSIIYDEDLTDASRQEMMNQSVDEFNAAVKTIIPSWASGKTSNKISKAVEPPTMERIENMKTAINKLKDMLEKSAQVPNDNNARNTVPKGETKDMKIDKNKLTAEEVAILDEIEKKAGMQDEPKQAEPDDIYKGMHPAIKAELENLSKFREAVEDRELTEVAKKYEIVGKKAAELVPLFKSLKTAGGNAYEQMIAVLDASVETVEKSGLFDEIGKRGTSEANAWTAIEKHASEIQKSMPTLTREQAIDKACQTHPELVQEYEIQR